MGRQPGSAREWHHILKPWDREDKQCCHLWGYGGGKWSNWSFQKPVIKETSVREDQRRERTWSALSYSITEDVISDGSRSAFGGHTRVAFQRVVGSNCLILERCSLMMQLHVMPHVVFWVWPSGTSMEGCSASREVTWLCHVANSMACSPDFRLQKGFACSFWSFSEWPTLKLSHDQTQRIEVGRTEPIWVSNYGTEGRMSDMPMLYSQPYYSTGG